MLIFEAKLTGTAKTSKKYEKMLIFQLKLPKKSLEHYWNRYRYLQINFQFRKTLATVAL
jgi:hypothetical protein